MKMKLLILISLLGNFTTYSNASDTNPCEEAIKKFKTDTNKIKKKKKGNYKQNGENLSSELSNCMDLTGDQLPELFKVGGTRVGEAENFWTDVIKKSDKCLEFAQKTCENNTLPTNDDAIKKVTNATNECITPNINDALTDLQNQASRCDGAAYILSVSGRDWTNSEHKKTPEVKGQTGVPQIICQGTGIETLDYEACVKFVQNGDGMEIVQGAIQKGQELFYADKTMTAQSEAALSPNVQTASLEALKTGVKSTENIMTQRAALDSGKLAVLATHFSDMPTHDSLVAKCEQYKSPNEFRESSYNGCKRAVDHGFNFLANQQSREKMISKLASVGINVTSDIVMASLMAKRAGDISNAIAKIETFKPINPLAPNNDLKSTFCQQNPGDQKCLTGNLERTLDATSENVINFSNGGNGTTSTNNPFIDPTAGTINTPTTPNGNDDMGIGSVVTPAQQNGGLADVVAKATVTKGNAPTAGGGGGGSGGGGSAGGGGGAPAGQQPVGGNSPSGPGKAPSYGGGSGTLSMMGGFGINKAKSTAKDDSNPFGKLFNKDGNKSGVVDFGRNPASKEVGNKGDNIFEMISKRYASVSNEKRLTEYEMTK